MKHKHLKTAVPEPAQPNLRREPLPWCKPKPVCEDAQCTNLLKAVMEHPSYLPAVQDVDFLNGADTRGLRLQLDYLKPERSLQEHGIQQTIVVFGSTRIVEPPVAQSRVDQLRQALAAQPDDRELKRKLAVAERILAKSHYYEVAREFSRLVANAGLGPDDSSLVVVTGGGPGMMEAANRGSHDVGGKTVGLNISLPHEQYPNPYVTPGLCFQFHYFALRKLHFVLRARALVAFPGGFGTFDELFETLTMIQTRKIEPLPIVLIGEEYWRNAFNIDFLVDEGVIDTEDRDLFWYAETAEEAWQGLILWYERKGESLIEGSSH